MSSHYGELRPTSGWNRFGCLWHPSEFQRLSSLGFVTAATSLTGGQPNFARCLAVSWAGTWYIHFRGLLPPGGILPGVKFTLRPSLAFSYIGSVTARHSSSGREPIFAAWYKEWNYRTFAEGASHIRLGSHHVGHRPTIHILVYYNPVRVSARMNEQTKWGETVTVKRTNCNRAINNPYIEITRTAWFKPRLHDTTCCQTGCTTRFDNRLYRVNGV